MSESENKKVLGENKFKELLGEEKPEYLLVGALGESGVGQRLNQYADDYSLVSAVFTGMAEVGASILSPGPKNTTLVPKILLIFQRKEYLQ